MAATKFLRLAVVSVSPRVLSPERLASKVITSASMASISRTMSRNPLAKKEHITLADLKPYPYLTYEQGNFNSFYFAEEPLTAIDFDCPRNIKVRDRATLFNLLDDYRLCNEKRRSTFTLCQGIYQRPQAALLKKRF